MNREPTNRGDKPGLRVARLIAATCLVFSLLAPIGLAVAPQPAAANVANTAPYYENESGTTNTSDWVPGDGNATAVRMLEMVARIPGMFIGTGDVDPSGSGYEGILLTGLVIGVATLFATIGVGVGPIAGSMLGIVLAYSLTIVGLIPVWVQPLLLFTLVGVPAAAAMLRVFRR